MLKIANCLLGQDPLQLGAVSSHKDYEPMRRYLTETPSDEPLNISVSSGGDNIIASFESDSESDDCSDAGDFPSHPTLDDYLIRPREYMSHLEKLRRAVVENSHAYRVCEGEKTKEDILPPYPPYYSHDYLHESTKILERVISSIDLLHINAFCTGSINVLVMDSTPIDVVHLKKIESRDIMALLKTARDCLELNQYASLRELERTLHYFDSILGIRCFSRFLDEQTAFANFFSLCTFLDLATIFYTSAHIPRFDEEYFEVDLNDLKIQFLVPRDLTLRHRSLACLDGLLGNEKVWVWHQHNYQGHHPLKVSTHIADLADIWGPIWPVTIEGFENMSTFQAGPGVLVPWFYEAGLKNEYGIPYHWTKDPSKAPKLLKDTSETRIDKNTLILIGGDCLSPPQSTAVGTSTHNVVSKTLKPRAMLKVNTFCTMKSSRITQKLRDVNRLRILGTQKPRIYRDSQTVTGSLGYMANLGGGITLKRSAGVALKDVLCSAWKLDGGNRNPRVLECWYGVEVSACTGNASRRRLKSILDSKAMRRQLDLCYPGWEGTDYGQFLSVALASKDVQAFRKLWDDNQTWQGDLQKLVSCCFEALGLCEVNANGEMSVLWMDDDNQGSSAIIPAGVSSWTGFLKDTELSCTMAILTLNCLELVRPSGSSFTQCDNGQISWDSGVHFLETALVVNRKAPVPKGLTRTKSCPCGEKACWDLQCLGHRDKFWLGSLGEITLIRPSESDRSADHVGHSQILARWERTLGTEFRNMFEEANLNILRGSPKPHHWEAMDLNDERRRPKPLGLVLISP